jgi:hypothetical protein
MPPSSGIEFFYNRSQAAIDVPETRISKISALARPTFVAASPRRGILLSHWVSTLDNAHEHCDHRDYQQYVNESTQGVGTDHSQQPKN